MTLIDHARQVKTREELAAFVAALVANIRATPEEWENVDLAAFLEGMAGWIEDMDGYYANTGEDMDRLPPWRLLADILGASRSYE